MRRLVAAELSWQQSGRADILGAHSGGAPQAVGFIVCALVLPATLAVCIWRWWTCQGSKKEVPPQPNPSAQSANGQRRSPSNSVRVPPAQPTSQDSATHHGGGDAAQYSSMTTDGPMPSAKPGQPANPVSLPTQQAKGSRQPGTPKAAPGPSYESDDEDDGKATAEGRLNDITRSVKGHAKAAGLDEAARRQAEEAAKRLAADRLHEEAVKPTITAAVDVGSGTPGTAAPSPKQGAPGTVGGAPPAAPDNAVAQAGPPGDMAVVADDSNQQSNVLYEIDLDIDLTKGELKVDYSTRGLLGQGGFAAVYKGRYKGQRVAVKMIKKTAGSSLADLQEDMNALMHELHILRQVNHPNIVTLFGGCLKTPHVFLVEERMEGTLDFYVHQVRKHDALSVREVVYFALDIACGLSYLHPKIVHRDLKPANVLLSREGRCKISDFGLARTKLKEYLSTKNLDAGTTAYIAPECFMSMDNPDMHDLRRSVTDRTDIYALGIILWEMLAGKRPWQGLKPLLVAYQVAYRSLRPPLFELGSRCSPKLRQLIEECWCQEPKQRPSSQQVVDRLLEILNELPPEQDYAYAQQPAPQPAPAPAPVRAAQQQQPTSHQVVSPHDVVLRT